MYTIEPSAYGAVLKPILLMQDLPSLGTGKPKSNSRRLLSGLTVGKIFGDSALADRDMAACCLAGLWLLHDFLEESHKFSQQIDTPAGSYWHGIMHRRDGDYSNAKYWFRRTGKHPIWPQLCENAAVLTKEAECGEQSEFLRNQKAWDPYAFVDLCEITVGSGSETEKICRNIQLCEWQLLFDFCYRRATGATLV